MTTPDHHTRPCDAPTARRRAARVSPPPCHGLSSPCSDSSCHGLSSPCSSAPPGSPNRPPRLSHFPLPTPHSLPGFSLVELTIVLAVVSILSAIAIPRYGSLIINYRIDAAANRIISDLSIAQSQARCKSAPQPVVFTAATNSYQLSGLVSQDSTSRQYIIKLTDDPYQVDLVSAAFGSAFSSSTITFDIYGRPDNGGTITLRCGTRTTTVTVDAATGKASSP